MLFQRRQFHTDVVPYVAQNEHDAFIGTLDSRALTRTRHTRAHTRDTTHTTC